MDYHTFVAAWGKFEMTLEDVMNLTILSSYWKTNAMSVTFEEDEDKLQRLVRL